MRFWKISLLSLKSSGFLKVLRILKNPTFLGWQVCKKQRVKGEGTLKYFRRKVEYTKSRRFTHAKMQFFRLQPLLDKFGQKNPKQTGKKTKQKQKKKKKITIVSSSWNLVPGKSMAVFTFSVLDSKHSFWENLVQKIKVVSWKLVYNLIRICRIQWWRSFFQFYTGNTLFGIRR